MAHSPNVPGGPAHDDLPQDIAELRARLREAEETIEAIRNGEVDAVVVGGPEGHRVYTLENADRPYRVLIEQMQEGAVTLTADGAVLYCNQRLTAMLGTPQERIVGGPFHRFVPDEDHATLDWLLSGSAEAGGRGEFTLLAMGGARVPVHLSFAVIPDVGERILCGIVTDLTQQRQRNHELAEANAKLVTEIAEREQAEAKLRQAQKMEAVGQLTGGIAHDFNNLLMVITGNLELVLGRLARDERLSTLVGHAMAAADRGARLTKQLLAFSRQQTLQPQIVCVNTLLPALASLVRHAVGAAITVEVVEMDGLWHCRTDPHQLENALLNLAINARDAMPDGGSLRIETANVTLDAQLRADAGMMAGPDAAPGRYVAVSVHDSGHGMSAETLARAFEPFFTTKEVGKGSGLGLSMIHGFVRQSGGFVTIHSNPGQGTRVSLHLPWAEARAAVAPVPAPFAPMRGGGHGTVLVVEDDEDVRRLVVQLVEDLGYSVIDVTDGPTALAVIDDDLAGRRMIDLLFSDVVMPQGMNGIDLARDVRSRRPDIAILLTSGFTAGTRVRDPGLEAEFPILRKPYRHEALEEAIRQALAERPHGPDIPPPAAPSPTAPAPIGSGRSSPRVLLVEDEMLVAMAVEVMLSDLGCVVVGPVATLAKALAIAGDEPLDAALLDVSLGGVQSYPIADVLAARGVPFVFATGYGESTHPAAHAAVPTLTKPYGFDQLTRAMARVLPAA